MIFNGTSSQDELYASKNDQVFGFEGDDILDASNGEGNNLLDGGSGSDRLFANNNDTLRGGIGADDLFAVSSSGFNILEAGEDNDRLFVVEGSNNKLDGASGNDRLTVSDGTGYNTLLGGLGNDVLNVSNTTGNNSLEGNEADDVLIGGLASDRLFGGSGDDLLFGGKKGSQLTGGTGKDRFFIASAAVPDVPVEVFDFTQGQDKLLINGIPEVQKFSDLKLEQIGLDTSIKVNINGELKEFGILRNVQANTLTSDDFEFQVGVFAISDASAIEGNVITFTITRTEYTQSEQSITVSTSLTAEDTASTADFGTKTETIIFEAGATQKSFTVQITPDFVFEGNETFTVSLSNPTNKAIINPTSGTAKGTINNDDPNPLVIITQTDGSTNVSEAGATDSYSVVLASQPTADVIVTINGGEQIQTSAKTLTFTTQNWNVAQNVTVTAVDDAIVEGDDSQTIEHTATSSDADYDGIAIDPVNVNISDNDNDDNPNPLVIITQTEDSTNVSEGGTDDSYSLVLASQPNADVIVTIDSGEQIQTSAKTLTFTTQNWNVAQNVTVTAVDDAIVEGDDSQTIEHTATSSDADYDGIAIDPVNINITDNDIPLSKNADNDIFTIKGNGKKTRLSVELTAHSSNQFYELGVFTVSDEQGNIGDIVPGGSGYTEAALQRAKVIFSSLANIPNGFNSDLTSLLEFNSGEQLRFYLVRNTTTDSILAGQTPISNVLFFDPKNLQIESLNDGSFSLAWKNQDLVVKIQPTDQELPLGASFQGKNQGELIDLRGVTQSVTAEFAVHREAAFNNFVGFYKVADENGGIDTNDDGVADILVGQSGYAEAAVRKRVVGIDLTVSNQGTASYTGTFGADSLFAPFIIVDGRPDAFLDGNPNNNPAIYFPFLGANTDKTDHIQLLGNNTFGFEDLVNGGDKDYNDVIVRVNLSVNAV
ncbi:DUF4114 domain-containing protein [Desmonostoc muscorum LEGE 12446]|uniref:DUF4114 domain-containing protein n=1 Tax=Desmonostoc muscorum TaxID=1179 RepID=UPI001F1B2BE7|nr:DUF4114 domain-containing protein [Desmonostoc muscorum]MCF2148705.1 DUF4114 domain-containing protein [Desmonostoc muscorum LEGE 12446]